MLNETACGHVKKLAPHITTAEQLDSLIKYARRRLEESSGVKRKAVQLGNCVSSYSGWKQENSKSSLFEKGQSVIDSIFAPTPTREQLHSLAGA